ncbi:MAG: hypothetical protein ABI678_01005 [Kofleriaceae bacterium]
MSSFDAACLEVRVELCIELDDAIDDGLQVIAELRNRVTISAGDGWDDRGHEVSVVLRREVGNLFRESLVRVRFSDRLQVLDRFSRRDDDLRVVPKMPGAELDQRMRLMDVLLAHLRGRHVARVLRVVEPGYL